MPFFNYFTDSEQGAAAKANQLKTRFASMLAPLLVRLGVPPDAISYTGLAMLIGVIVWFVAHPYRTVVVLILYLIFDAIDGGYARYLDRPTQAGAFTDVVIDQMGMVVVALGFIYYDFVGGQVGAYYIMIYIIMIIFSLLQNAQGIPMQYIFRSKYVLYLIYALWAVFRINLAPYLLPVFSVMMTVSCVQSFWRLKQGFHEKYDQQRIAEHNHELAAQGIKPPRFRRVWNILLPSLSIAALLFFGAYTYLATMLEWPDAEPEWLPIETLPLADRHEQAQGVTAYGDGFFISTLDSRTRFSRVYYVKGPMLRNAGHFTIPWEMSSNHGMCASDDQLFFVNRLSHRVLSIDPEASLEKGVAVALAGFDTTLDAPVSCTLAEVDGQTRMLVTEYMHTHRTLAIDYKKALVAGSADGYVVAWYRNGGFAHGMSGSGNTVYEVNGSLWGDIIYQIDLPRTLGNKYLRSGIIQSIQAPGWYCNGIAVSGKTMIALDKRMPYRTTLP